MSRKRPRVPGTASPKPAWWEVMLIGTGRCDNPDCDCVNEHDPAGAFAYTCGLYERMGLSELWLPAAPANPVHSEIPVMPGYELGWVLNEITEGYVAGTYVPGQAVVVHNWPGGFEVTIRLEDECVDRDEVECLRAHPEAEIRPLSWCAHREGHRAMRIADGAAE